VNCDSIALFASCFHVESPAVSEEKNDTLQSQLRQETAIQSTLANLISVNLRFPNIQGCIAQKMLFRQSAFVTVFI